MKDIYSKISEARDKNKDIALCTIVHVKGSTPRKTGAKMIVYADQSIYGTIGGGELEKSVIKDAIAAMSEGSPKFFRHDLLHQHNMCCGGTVDVYIEPIMKKNKLYIFGSGHTGQTLAKYGVNFNFDVFLIDDRKEYLSECATEGVNKMNLSFEQALGLLPFDEQTYICIMTYSHPLDRDILAFCIKKPHAYLGMIGSKRKVEMTKKMFIEAGVCSFEKLEGIDMPMGIDIGAEGPEEIALSILAKIVSEKNKVVWEKELH